ncbi:MAG: glycosyltransferase [Candidatus Nanopelagicales bacterium]
MSPSDPTPGEQPRFSIVSAVYNVARYLPDFINSIDSQVFDLSRVEVIMVDDGSTDESPEVLRQWQERAPGLVTIVTKENGGQGSARNMGITYATGEWITFTDPDDILAPEYLSQIATFLDGQPEEPAMVVGNLIVYEEDKDRLINNHPLRARFKGGDQLVDLERFPDYFHMHVASAFLPRTALLEAQVNFDDRVRPLFEDAHFIARYLLLTGRPLIGFVASAHYQYRRRSDQSSSLQTATSRPERFTAVPRYGYLDVLQLAKQKYEDVPTWLQNTMIYELSWLLRAEEALVHSMRAVDHGVEDEYHELVSRVTAYLDTSVIERFEVLSLPPSRVSVLAHAYRAAPWHEDGAVMDRFDPDRRLVRLTYLYTGSAPSEAVRWRGLVSEPVHSKTRALIYSGRTLVNERVLWVRTDGSLELVLDGVLVPLWRHRPRRKVSWRPADVRRAFGVPDPTPKSAQAERNGAPRAQAARVQPGQGLGRPSPGEAPGWWEGRRLNRLRSEDRFADAWLLMDRDINSHDNAEHLFRYLRRNRPDINAWFTVKAGTKDWERLNREGLGNVVAHGSREWMAVSLAARHLISSHIDHYVVRPADLLRFGTPKWRYTFLQHGVTKDDLSAWLNNKPIDLMLTTTQPEFESIIGNGSPYRLTSKEVQLTGFPRHDRLARLGLGTTPENRKNLLIMPTWRQFLLGAVKPGSGERALIEDFDRTQFSLEWSSLISSSRVAEAARSMGLKIVFMPHPNLEPYLPQFRLPDDVRVVSYRDCDVQEMLAGAAAVVTDYSSIAFDAALIERPVVYFQFDRAAVFGGQHLTRPGYFSYARDGFGPLTEDLPAALDAIEEVVAAGPTPQQPYLDRIHSTFPFREGGNCARVTKAILNLSRPSKTPVTAPEAPPIVRD